MVVSSGDERVPSSMHALARSSSRILHSYNSSLRSTSITSIHACGRGDWKSKRRSAAHGVMHQTRGTAGRRAGGVRGKRGFAGDDIRLPTCFGSLGLSSRCVQPLRSSEARSRRTCMILTFRSSRGGADSRRIAVRLRIAVHRNRCQKLRAHLTMS